jgi:5'-3' exoribonuclease 1
MFELNRHLEYFVQYKINTDPMHKRLEVVLSGSSVPGEGEHKMMDFIRQAKTHEGYDPNNRYCF